MQVFPTGLGRAHVAPECRAAAAGNGLEYVWVDLAELLYEQLVGFCGVVDDEIVAPSERAQKRARPP